MARKFVVNPLSITYEQIQNELRLLIANNQNTFTDFFNDGSGSSVIDLASALGAFFAFHIIAQRKEFTLEQAVSYKSLIGNAYDKGYNVHRGTNLRVNLTAIPETTGTLTEWTTIGSYDEFDIVLMKNVSFTAGVPCTLEVVIGNRMTESLTAMSNNATIFRYTVDDVTDDVRLLLNGTEVPYSTSITDLLNDKYLMMSNSYGSVNVFYLQDGQYNYSIGDTLMIDYIARNTVDTSSVSADGFYLQGFTVTDVAEAQARVTLEQKDDIRIGAALHAETSGIIKARGDFKKVLQEMDKTIKSINDFDIQPGRIGIIVLKDDYTALTDEDKKRYNSFVSSKSVSGVANLNYSDAHVYNTDINIVLTGLEGVATSSTLVPNTENHLNKYQYELGGLINFDDIEDYIEKELDGVKIARITMESPVWTSRAFRASDSCIATKFNNKTYYVERIVYRTGDSAPDWNSLTNGYVVDNEILWKEYNGEPEGIMVWKPHVTVTLGKLVVDTLDSTKRVFECVGYVAKTGEVEPDWKSGEMTIFDNQVVWLKVSPEPETLAEWTADTLLPIGKVLHKRFNSAVEETYQNKVAYTYYSEIFGGTFYTAQPLANSVECFSDEELATSIGVASNLDLGNNTVTITPLDSSGAKTGSFEDYTIFEYLGSTSGTFYTEKALENGLKCYADPSFKNLLGTIEVTNAEANKIKITTETDITEVYYKVADYAAKSGEVEPNWLNKTLEGYIEDGQLLWKETNYPMRFIKLADDTYVKFNSNIRMES